MKYNIYINQKWLSELSDSKWIKIDLIDWAIINWIKDFHNEPKTRKINIEWKQYFWIAYSYIIKELPLLWIKTKWAVAERLNKLVSLWLLEKYFDKDWWSMTYFYCKQEFYDLERGKGWKQEGYGFEKVGGTVWKHNNNNTNHSNTNIIINKEKKKKETLDIRIKNLDPYYFINKFNLEEKKLKSYYEEFYLYRTETNDWWKKEKWEMNKTWNTKWRLITWITNGETKFSRKKQTIINCV